VDIGATVMVDAREAMITIVTVATVVTTVIIATVMVTENSQRPADADHRLRWRAIHQTME